MTTAVASFFSRNGLDDTKEINEIKQGISQMPGGNFYPIPGLNIKITASDLAEGTPREIRMRVFRRFTEPIYDKGEEGLRELATSPQLRESISSGLGIFAVFTAKTNQTIGAVTVPLAVVSLIFLLFFVWFSRRFGRLFNPGFVFVIVAGPVFLLSLAFKNSAPPGTPSVESAAGMANIVASAVVPLLQPIVFQTYLIATLIGGGLLALAILGRLVWLALKRN